MESDLSQVIDQVVRERGVSKEVIIEALEAAMVTAARKKLGLTMEIEAQYNPEIGEVELFRYREVVTEIEDEQLQISLLEAKSLDPDCELGDMIGEKLQSYNFGRISAQMAKQVIIQKVRDAEKEQIYDEYKDRKNDIVNGIVRRFERGSIIVDLGRAEAVMPHREQIPRESYQPGDRIRGYILDVVKSTTSPQIILSRACNEFLLKLFELEVPEIYEGIVTIMSAAREPGSRSKIAVASSDINVDPVGACVGMKGSRVQAVVNELRGEKIDIVPWSENAAKFVCNALLPAQITKVILDEENKEMEIIVPDDQLSLAIGRRGQNVRLAVMLTGWKIDIHSESKMKELDDVARRIYAEIPEINQTLMELLIRTGFRAIDDLADADPEDLMAFPNVELEIAQSIVSQANELIDSGRVQEILEEIEAEKEPEDEVESGEAEDVKPAPEIAVNKLEGVGSKTAELLTDAGLDTANKIIESNVEEIVKIQGIGTRKAERIIEAARTAIEEAKQE